MDRCIWGGGGGDEMGVVCDTRAAHGAKGEREREREGIGARTGRRPGHAHAGTEANSAG